MEHNNNYYEKNNYYDKKRILMMLYFVTLAQTIVPFSSQLSVHNKKKMN